MNNIVRLPHGVDAVLVVGAPNLYYLSGFLNEDAAIVLLPDRKFYITDSRYSEDAAKKVKEFAVIIVEKGESYICRALKILKEHKVYNLGIEELETSVKEYDELKNGGICQFVYCSDWFCGVRAVKNDIEIALMRQAQAITDAAFDWALNNVAEGISEIELARSIERKMSESGGDGTAFGTIVAFGENTSLPHAQCGERKLRRGDLITMDFGAKYKGYCSDMTRTFAFGRPDDEKISVYGTVLEAQTKAIDAVHIGMKASDLDAVCRGHFKNKGLDGFFIHSTGHGLGIEIHERLAISAVSTDILTENNVFSIEPGLYFPGKFGIRIEDVVRLVKNGAENLTKSPKHLIML